MHSAIYRGTVTHHRLRPVQHRLRYPAFFCLIDLDEIGALDSACRLFSSNGWNLFALCDRDYAEPGKSVRRTVTDRLAARGIDAAIGRIRLLTMPRVCGYGFNPISVFYCFDSQDRLVATLYDVTNMRRERIAYALPVAGAAGGAFFQSQQKAMRVSPFTADRGQYTFHGTAPGERVALGILYREDGSPLLRTLFTGERHEFSDRALLRSFAAMPLQSLAVVAAIHVQALRLWLKGVPLARKDRGANVPPVEAIPPLGPQARKAVPWEPR